NSFDLVCAYAVLHHIKDHARAVREMVRVARYGVFLSDANNFGQGPAMARAVKQAINAAGLWRAYDWMATRGKGYHYSEGDGVFYSYSITNAVPILRSKFSILHSINTLPSAGLNLGRQAPHMALFATNRSLAG
ncbi:MAG: methyltransferase domain-containing protein, partial [Sphingopyxis sp.]